MRCTCCPMPKRRNKAFRPVLFLKSRMAQGCMSMAGMIASWKISVLCKTTGHFWSLQFISQSSPESGWHTSPLRRTRRLSVSAILEQSFHHWNISRRTSCGWSLTTLSFLKLIMNSADGMLSVCSQRNRQIRSRNLFTVIGKTVGHWFASAILVGRAARQ